MHHSPTDFEQVIWGEVPIQLDNAVLGVRCHVALNEREVQIEHATYAAHHNPLHKGVQ